MSFVPELLQQMDAAIQASVTAMDAVMDRLAPKTASAVTLFRGVHDVQAKGVLDTPVGGATTAKGFLSTSVDPDVARTFMGKWGCLIILHLPKGTPYYKTKVPDFSTELFLEPTHASIAVVVVQLEGFEASPVPKFSDYGPSASRGSRGLFELAGPTTWHSLRLRRNGSACRLGLCRTCRQGAVPHPHLQAA